MKRANNLIEKIADSDNLRLAFLKARKGKTYAPAVERYAKQLDEHLLQLRAQILTGEVTVGRFYAFKIYEPKERQINAPTFEEQVLHHALMNVCHPIFERRQLYESFASRIGKGTHAARIHAQSRTRARRFYLKMDVKKFFDSVHHATLKRQLGALIRDKTVISIFSKIIDSYKASSCRGLPIGNLTSQYFANHFLLELDIFIKETLRASDYVRYMDDFVLWHDDIQWLKHAQHQIELFANQTLHVELKTPTLNRSDQGLTFLGCRIFPQKMDLTRPARIRFFQKYTRACALHHTGEWPDDEFQRHVFPLLDFVQCARTGGLRGRFFSERFGFSEKYGIEGTQIA
jgi:RNA-directed DNA polymerase